MSLTSWFVYRIIDINNQDIINKKILLKRQ